MNRWQRALAAAVLILTSGPSTAQESYELGDLEVRRGEAASGRILVPPAGDDEGTTIPVTVVHGAQPGPVFSVIAGVHGSEYAPILAVQRLRPLVDPSSLSGTLVLVHIANLPAFLGRTVYVGPVDRKNLNRSFPGKPDGTLTERLAFTLTRDVIECSDFMMDVHAGDGNESLRPSYTGYYAEAGGADVIEKSRRMALAFGLDTIVPFRGDLTTESAIWCGSAAVARGIPSIDIESGEMGRAEERRVQPIVDGTLSVMRHLGMLPGEATPTTQPLFVGARSSIPSGHDGVWHPDPRVRTGHFVVAGARIGVISDFFGNELETIRAPISGIVLITLSTPPVNEGETIAVIADVSEP